MKTSSTIRVTFLSSIQPTLTVIAPRVRLYHCMILLLICAIDTFSQSAGLCVSPPSSFPNVAFRWSIRFVSTYGCRQQNLAPRQNFRIIGVVFTPLSDVKFRRQAEALNCPLVKGENKFRGELAHLNIKLGHMGIDMQMAIHGNSRLSKSQRNVIESDDCFLTLGLLS